MINKMASVALTTLLLAGLLMASAANAATPETNEQGVTVIHVAEYGGYFTAEETLAGLSAGEYEFIVTNKSDKLVGFQVQNFISHETLDMFPLKPGEVRSSKVTVTTDGIRYRCPINPTPWYELDVIKAKES